MQGFTESDGGKGQSSSPLFHAIIPEEEYGIYHALGNMSGTRVPSGKAGGVWGLVERSKSSLVKAVIRCGPSFGGGLAPFTRSFPFTEVHEVSGARVRT